MSDNQERITCVEEAITSHRNRLDSLKKEVEILGNVEEGQWAEMYAIKEVLREFISWVEMDTMTETGLLDRLSGDSKTEKKEPEKNIRIIEINDPDLVEELRITKIRLKDYQRLVIKYRDEIIPKTDIEIKKLLIKIDQLEGRSKC